jgi:enamine deaminase RidA (YjgF/YER057c/UK114 family)
MSRSALIAFLLVSCSVPAGTENARPRLKEEKPAGQRVKLSLGTIFVPDDLPAKGKIPLFLHFHGPGWIAEVAATRSGKCAVLHAHLGSGSSVYGKPFADPKRLRELLVEATRKSGREFELVGLSGWSAGYGAVRAILRVEEYYRQVQWVILMDGLHAGYTADRKPIEVDLDCYLRLARDAVAGRRRFLVTHTRIVPERYASTTETADYLIRRTNGRRSPVLTRKCELPVESEVEEGGLHILGCAGQSAPDHVDHLHVLPGLLRLVGADSPLKVIGNAVVVDDVALVQTTQLIPRVGKPTGAQVQELLRTLDVTLRPARSGMDKVVRLHWYAASEDVVPTIRKSLDRQFAGAHKPAVTIVVGTPVREGVAVSLDAVAVSGLPGKAGLATKIGREGNLAILPAGPVYHVAGQAERGKTLAESTRKTLASLDGTLKFLDRTREQIVQVKCFVHPMKEIPQIRKEIALYFDKVALPPITFVEWTATDSIEIELVVAGQSSKEKRPGAIDYLTPPGMKASPIYSRVARINHGKRVYTSGLVGTGTDGTAQVKDAFAQLGNILKEAGSDFKHLAKATYYVSTDDASKQLNALRPGYYDPNRPPSASKAPVQGTDKKESGIILDMIAVVP